MITEVTTPTISSAYECASAAAPNTPSLAMKPGGRRDPRLREQEEGEQRGDDGPASGRTAWRSSIEWVSSRPPRAVTSANAPIVMNEYTSR